MQHPHSLPHIVPTQLFSLSPSLLPQGRFFPLMMIRLMDYWLFPRENGRREEYRGGEGEEIGRGEAGQRLRLPAHFTSIWRFPTPKIDKAATSTKGKLNVATSQGKWRHDLMGTEFSNHKWRPLHSMVDLSIHIPVAVYPTARKMGL